MKKVFIVNAEVEIPVYAEDEKEARELARKNMREIDSYEFAYSAHEQRDLKFLDPDLAESLPFGTPDDKTVKQLIEEALVANNPNQVELKL